MGENPNQGELARGRDIKSRSHAAYLESILQQAINPEALKEIMKIIGLDRTIIDTEARNISSWACFRVQAISGKPYILCPVPFLYDDQRGIETGFAIDVDQDYFFVYPYMHDYSPGNSIVLSQLPHCVHRAITIDASSYEDVSDEIKEISNEASAIFFISNLVNDFAVGMDTPIEFFDDKLYLQLVERTLEMKDAKWISNVVINKKFELLMRQLEALDADAPLYVNNKLRVFTNISRFLSGFEGMIGHHDLVDCLDPAIIQEHEQVIFELLHNNEFLKTMEENGRRRPAVSAMLALINRGNLVPSPDIIKALYEHLHENVKKNPEIIGAVIDFIARSGIKLEPNHARDLYSIILEKGLIDEARKLEKIHGKKPEPEQIHGFYQYLSDSHDEDSKPYASNLMEIIDWMGIYPDHSEVQQIYKTFLQEGLVNQMKIVAKITGVQPEEAWIQALYTTFSETGFPKTSNVNDVIEIMSWVGVQIDPRTLQGMYLQLFMKGQIQAAKSLVQFTNDPPSRETIASFHESIATKGFEHDMNVDYLLDIMKWTDVIPEPRQIQDFLFHLLIEEKIDAAKKLMKEMGINLDEETAQRIFKEFSRDAFYGYNLNDAIKMIFACTGMHPDPDQVQTLYKKILQRDKIHQAKVLEKETGVSLNPDIIEAIYASLAGERYDYPLASESFLDLVEWTGILPSEEQLQDICINFLAREKFASVDSILYKYNVILTSDRILKTLVNLASHDMDQENIESLHAFLDWAGAAAIEGLVPEVFLQLLMKSNLNGAKILLEMTRCKVPEIEIQQFYNSIPASKACTLTRDFLAQLVEWTGIHPDPDQVQAMYMALFKIGNITEAMKLHDLIKVLPVEDTIQAGYRDMNVVDFENDENSMMALLEAWSGVEPSKETLKKVFHVPASWNDIDVPKGHWFQKKYLWASLDDFIEPEPQSNDEIEKFKAWLKKSVVVFERPLQATVKWISDVFLEKVLEGAWSRHFEHLGITDPDNLAPALNLGLLKNEEDAFLGQVEHVAINRKFVLKDDTDNIEVQFNKGKKQVIFVEWNSLDASQLFLSSMSEIEGIETLTRLEALFLSHNALTELTDPIKGLSRLKILLANDNKTISTIPAWIDSLDALEEIDLSRNQITSLPDSIFSINSLKRLVLENNKLTHLPGSCRNVPILHDMNASYNVPEELPEVMNNLPNLEYLDVSENMLTSIPDSINALSGLHVLKAKRNQIRFLPGSICSLSNLDTLELANNNLEKLPEFSSRMPALREIDLGKNKLLEIPASIENLQSLEILTLNDNDLESIPDSIKSLEKLRILTLASNTLFRLPESISRLHSLVSLDLRNNKLEAIPDDFAFPASLKLLRLDHNQLHGIPASIKNKKSFINISFDGNPIEKDVATEEDKKFEASHQRFRTLVTRYFESDEMRTKISGNTLAFENFIAKHADKKNIPLFCVITVFVINELKPNLETPVDEDPQNIAAMQQRMKEMFDHLFDELLISPGDVRGCFTSSLPTIETWMDEYENGTLTGTLFFKAFVIQFLRSYLVEKMGMSSTLVEEMVKFDAHDEEKKDQP